MIGGGVGGAVGFPPPPPGVGRGGGGGVGGGGGGGVGGGGVGGGGAPMWNWNSSCVPSSGSLVDPYRYTSDVAPAAAAPSTLDEPRFRDHGPPIPPGAVGVGGGGGGGGDGTASATGRRDAAAAAASAARAASRAAPDSGGDAEGRPPPLPLGEGDGAGGKRATSSSSGPTTVGTGAMGWKRCSRWSAASAAPSASTKRRRRTTSVTSVERPRPAMVDNGEGGGWGGRAEGERGQGGGARREKAARGLVGSVVDSTRETRGSAPHTRAPPESTDAADVEIPLDQIASRGTSKYPGYNHYLNLSCVRIPIRVQLAIHGTTYTLWTNLDSPREGSSEDDSRLLVS